MSWLHSTVSVNKIHKFNRCHICTMILILYDPEYAIPESLMEILFKKDEWMVGIKSRIVYIVREVLKEQNKEKNEVIKSNIEKFLNG